LSRDGIVTVSESAESVRPAIALLRKAASRHLAHCDSSDHLDGIRGCRLPELSPCFRCSLILRPCIGGILVLTVETYLLKGAPPASLSEACCAPLLPIAAFSTLPSRLPVAFFARRGRGRAATRFGRRGMRRLRGGIAGG